MLGPKLGEELSDWFTTSEGDSLGNINVQRVSKPRHVAHPCSGFSPSTMSLKDLDLTIAIMEVVGATRMWEGSKNRRFARCTREANHRTETLTIDCTLNNRQDIECNLNNITDVGYTI